MTLPITYSPKAALLVIDMQEFFRSEATYIIPNIQYIVTYCHKKDIPVIWTQHGHKNIKYDGGGLGKWWKDNFICWGTEEWKLLKELEPFVLNTNFVINSKTRYDAFYKTELDSLLISLGIETLIISGVKTNLCCESTARRGFDKNYNIVFIKDATATESQQMHEATLLNMEYGYAKVVNIIDVVKWLEKL